MPVPTLISELSTNAASNSPDGAIDTPSSLDNYQRAHASFIAQLRDNTGFTTAKASSGANSDITSLSALSTALSIAQGGTGAVTANAAADALGAFRRGTLLGTVSQTSGVPTGAVIERGSNANGEYVRFADGMQICTHTLPTFYATGIATAASWTFPAAFISTPSVPPFTGTPRLTNDVYGFIHRDTVTTTSITQVFRNGATAQDVDWSLALAIGRWF